MTLLEENILNNNIVLSFTIPIEPRTKKNSQSIIINKGRPLIIPSSAYSKYEKECRPYIPAIDKTIDYPVNVKANYFMKTHRRVDLVNLLQATSDMLVHYKIIEDDNCKIIKSYDGSTVDYDKENPRVEIEITAIKL